MVTGQKYLHSGGLIILVGILSMVSPLSTDVYMPALPSMVHEFGVNTVTVNLTLIVFFFFMAIGMLFFGPLSDKSANKKSSRNL